MKIISMLAGMAALALAACDRKETVFEMETPGGKVEVEKDKDTGAVEIEVDDKE